jgi:hypothetical protein
MNKATKQLPLAPYNCERMAKTIFSLNMSPEEYAARYSADWFCFSFHRYYYRDPQLDEWIQRLGAIFSNPELLAKCQAEILSVKQLSAVKKRLEKDFKLK